MKSRNILLLMLIVLVFSSCSIIYEIELYVQDIIASFEQDDIILTPATVGFDSPGESNEEKLISFIKGNFRNVSNIRKGQVDYSTYIFCNTELPIIFSDEYKNTEDLLYIKTNKNQEDEIEMNLIFSKEKFNEINSYTKEEFWQTIDVSDIKISFELVNDTRNTINFDTKAMYVNNNPIIDKSDIILEKRKRIDLKFSDVLRDSLGIEQSVSIGKIKIINNIENNKYNG